MHICYVDERAPACMYVCVCVCVNVWLYILIYWHQLWPHSIEYLIMWNWGLPIKLWYVGFGSVKPNRTAEEAPASVTNYDDVSANGAVWHTFDSGCTLQCVRVCVCVCVYIFCLNNIFSYHPSIVCIFSIFFPISIAIAKCAPSIRPGNSTTRQ